MLLLRMFHKAFANVMSLRIGSGWLSKLWGFDFYVAPSSYLPPRILRPPIPMINILIEVF